MTRSLLRLTAVALSVAWGCSAPDSSEQTEPADATASRARPNIDRLAREGARFLNAFTTTPLCSPARASLLTGQYAHTNGIIDNVERGPVSHQLNTFPRQLHQAGYEMRNLIDSEAAQDTLVRMQAELADLLEQTSASTTNQER